MVVGGRYELGELLGSGGMADVYRAHDTLLHRPVAVKLLRDGTDSEADRARFSSEARTLAQLSHSGLVMVLDAGITDEAAAVDDGRGAAAVAAAADRPYLVMDLVEGPTLSQALADGPLPLADVGAIAVQLAEALAYAHEHGVVHRDVKPGNVLLGPDGRVKLADFGIARLIGDTVRHTRTGQAIGTAAYLAPEQVTGKAVDGAADVYALGLMVLEAVTGTRTYAGGGTEAALARLSRQPDVPEHLPETWRRLLREMTAIEPADRPSAAAVASRLRTQPTGPIPVAVEQEAPADATRPLTGRVPQQSPKRGSDLAGAASRLVERGRAGAVRMSGDQWGVVGAVGALVVLILVVALLAGNDPADDGLPPNTPPELSGPLSELHDAVEGR